MRICLDMGSFQDFDKFPVIAVIDAYEDKVRFNFSQITFTEIYAIIHRTGLGIRCKEKSKSLRRLVLPEELFYDVDLWLILVASVGGFLLATEAGFLLGRRSQSNTGDDSRSQIYTIQGATLGLLALLLGFTFAMAMSRYDTRKQMVLDESNAIGTTFLRAQLLPEPTRTGGLQPVAPLCRGATGIL